MSDPRRHHYVPQFYFKRFCNPTDPPFLQVYNFQYGKWSRKPPSAIAWEQDLYAFLDEIGVRHNFVETGYNKTVEDRVVPLIEKIENRQTLTPEERRDFARFMAFSLVRVPVARANWDNYFGSIERRALKIYWRRGDMLKALNKKRRRDKLPALTKRDILERLRRDHDGTEPFKASQVQQLRLMISMVEEAWPGINGMFWTFWHSEDPHWFVTSDNPVSWRNPVTGRFGLYSKDVELYFPVTRNILLIAKYVNVEEDGRKVAAPELAGQFHLPMWTDAVTAYNAITIASSDKIIVAPSRNAIGQEYLDNKKALGLLWTPLESAMEVS
jgi:hypothetical protein